MLTVHRSNRAEALADALADLLARPPEGARPADALCEEWVVVPSPGMERWLAMRIARKTGVCADVRFPFPAALVQEALAAVAGQDPESVRAAREAWSGRRIAWRVVGAVRARVAADPRYAPLRAYLGDGAGPGAPLDARAWGMLKRIAGTFDDYLTYRQQMLRDWDAGALQPREPDDWQPDLWAAVCAATPVPHPARVAQAFFDALGHGTPALEGIPPRICLFGVSTLPPFYLQVIQALARFRDMHLFTLDPCRFWWGDVQTPGEKALRRRKDRHARFADLHLEDGNPLLASMGLLGRDFQNVLFGDGGPAFDEADDAPFADPAEAPGGRGPTALDTLVSDLLNLRARAPGADDPECRPVRLRPDDRSLTFHACHGPMRQVEVLHDHLLRRFDEDPTLQPRDVVVMTPDIEAYAPLIEAVFSEGRRGGADPGFPLLPFHVADRGLRSQNPVAEAVARVLALPETRMTASEVLDLLALEPVRRRFGLAEDDLPAIRRWVDESGIRWGIDADDRARHGQPAADANTWRFGLDRLLLGYAMPGEDRTFGGVLPFDAVEGGPARTLGRFADACETLFAQVRALAAPRSLADWRATLDDLLDDLVRTAPGDAWRVRQVQDLGRRIADEAGDAFGGAVTLDAYRAILEEGFGTAGAGTGFLGGAVTFCAMVPLRAIPFRVVCLLGLDDGRFPRQRDRLAFDRMAGRPQPGDRTPRDDDNYMFLEALISARDSLAVFFTGQHIADNKELPPAVPVAELLDVVDATFATDSGRPARDLLLRRHALQPFSPRNFQPGDPFSYDGRFLEGAKRLLGVRGTTPALFAGLLDDPVTARADGGPEPLGVGLDALIRFVQNPVEFLLKERLGLRLELAAADLRDREPIELAPLEAYRVGDAVMRHLLDGTDPDAARALAVGRGELPLGSPGRVAFDAIVERAAPVVRVARAAREGRVETNCAIRFEHGPLRLEGTVEGIWGDGLIDVTYARVSARNRLRTWIRHVAASWAVPGFDGPSRCLALGGDGKDGCQTVTFAPLGPDPEARRAAAAAVLGRLLDLFRAGLRSPLPLLPKASAKYAETLRSKGDTAEGRSAARRAAAGAYGSNETFHQIGDDANPYVARVFGASPSFEDDVPVPGIPSGAAPGFHAVTVAVWDPLLDAQAAGARQGGGR